MLQSVNPHWGDEQLFQESRRILSAQMQMITYNEFLPAVLGNQIMESYKLSVLESGYTEYNQEINPSTTIEFSSAGFRCVGHSMISGKTYKAFFDGSKKEHPLKYGFHFLPGFHDKQLDYYVRGMITEPIQSVDIFIDDVVRNDGERISKNGPQYGVDFVVVDLMRGRDHGVASYASFRKYCFNHVITSFSDLSSLMPENAISKLSRMYANVRDVDLYIGALYEYHLKGSIVGPTASCIWAIQFYRLKYGDRYYFEHGSQTGTFTQQQLDSLRQTSLAKLFCQNGDHYGRHKIQGRVMQLPSADQNPEVACSSLPDLDIRLWQEFYENYASKISSSSFSFTDMFNLIIQSLSRTLVPKNGWQEISMLRVEGCSIASSIQEEAEIKHKKDEPSERSKIHESWFLLALYPF